MDDRPNPENRTPDTARTLRAGVAAALDWWRAAGVDGDFSDAPHSWLRAPDEDEQGPAPRPAALPDPDTPPPPARLDEDMPDTLEAWQVWWLNNPVLDEGRVQGRISPTGPAGADLMVLVEHPEDVDQTQLLSGPQGRLLEAMLAAFGFSRAQVYIASVLPRHTPAADWSTLRARGLGGILARHIELARPQRLMTLGGHILSLLEHEPPQRPAVLTQFNQGMRKIPMLATRDLAALLHRPQAKAAVWKTWLDWTA